MLGLVSLQNYCRLCKTFAYEIVNLEVNRGGYSTAQPLTYVKVKYCFTINALI